MSVRSLKESVELTQLTTGSQPVEEFLNRYMRGQMITQTPRDFHENLSRAILACKRAQCALIDVGAIAAPEGGTEIHNWQSLNIHLQTAMRLLIGLGESTEDRVSVGSFADDRAAREASCLTAPHWFDDPGLDEAISDLVDRVEMVDR